MPRADGVGGGVTVGGCSCGCGSMTVGESTAHESCGCGCGSTMEHAEAKTPAEEAAELRAMREAIDRRLEELAS